jgi:hypothetical protein
MWIPHGEGDWDDLGRAVAVIGFVAMLTYLLPRTMRLTPHWRGRMRAAALALVGIALALAIVATVAWFLR